MIRVLVVDDHPVVRSGLTSLLNSSEDLSVVGAVASGEEALLEIERVLPDAILCDLRLGSGLDGVGVTAAVSQRPDAPPVVILTTYDNDHDIVRAIMAGAAGYLLKDAPVEDIAQALRDAVDGRLVFGPGLEQRATDRMTAGVPALSERERDVLALVADGLANKEIARRLYISEATVKTHLVHAFGKLGADSRTSAVAKARAHNLLP